MRRRLTPRRPPLRGPVLLLLGLALLYPPPAATAAAPAPVTGFVEAYPAVGAAMRAAGAPYADWAANGRHFLAFDPSGDGRAVEVLGDLADAERIVLLVPGVDTTLRDFDRGLGGVARRAPAVQARHLYGRLRADDPSARVAVIAWLGYDPPDGLGWAAARETRARSGAVALTDLTRLLAAHRPTATITLVGHSYGAVLLGLAAPRLPAQVTDLVSVGGVGMGAGRVSGLRSRARVWAAEAPDDWIRRVPGLRLFGLGHGTRPADPAFGARPLPVDGVTGHDGYLVPGTGTLAAVSAVALGRSPGTPR
ncbi:alpha/beta hydrolase [Micromonospora sp. NPDC050397]|uniref:alpha/beta hydrolase n=1 Tax=Micromonospora sp. NPDC050397 TaxID=3364279 RepID=UPI0038510D64